jgi:DNA-binding MarR family transcriptional regulator
MSSGDGPPGHLGETLGPLVKNAHQRLMALADAALEPHDLDRREFGVLRVLADGGPMSQQGTAASVGIDATTMVALVDALEAKGVVTRRPDPADRRRNAVELTDAGRAVYRAADAAYAAAEAEFLAPLTSAQAAQFRLALRALSAVA